MTKRDNFRQEDKTILAKRVAFFCSNPDCRLLTIGPAKDSKKGIVNTGDAAHISAASPGGCRYDSTQTPEQRKDIDNGIWLCGVCSKLIDRDTSYTREILYNWKSRAEAETEARQRQYQISKDENIEKIIQNMMESALTDIGKFFNEENTIFLSCTKKVQSKEKNGLTPTNEILTLEDIAKILRNGTCISFVSSPGTGKTTTLCQLVKFLIEKKHLISVFIPLAEWLDSKTFFEFLLTRNAFRLFKPEHFMFLADSNHLILVLDGWNELTVDLQKRAIQQIKNLQRDYPNLGIVVSTRSQTPLDSEIIINIEPLTEPQQKKLAKILNQKNGMVLLKRAKNLKKLYELIKIPLYLKTLLSINQTDELPETKEEILKIFVTQHENELEKEIILGEQLFGCQKEILIELACDGIISGTTALSSEKARCSITKTLKALQNNQQITTLSQPEIVIKTLVNAHLLACSSINSINTISFQHQQFQEWYASFKVEQLMLDSLKESKNIANLNLHIDILNLIQWEESILFACERLSRKDSSGIQAVSKTILVTLGIDPMLAAEMIYCSGTEVWSIISGNVMSFVEGWHQSNTIDRAIRFMIISGRPDFSAYIWPFISNSDNQLSFQIFDLTYPFHTSVLGADAIDHLSELTESHRLCVIPEIAYRGEFDGIELAANLAKTEPNPEIVIKILESLIFRHAEEHVTNILNVASEKVWELLARQSYPRALSDKAQNNRLKNMRDLIKSNETNTFKIIDYLLEKSSEEFSDFEKISKLLQSPEFPIRDEFANQCIQKVFNTYPDIVITAIFQRISNNLEIPYRSEEYLKNRPVVDKKVFTHVVLNAKNTIPKVLYSIADHSIIWKLINDFIKLDEKFLSNENLNSIEHEEYSNLLGAILFARQSSFFSAFMKCSNTKQLGRIESLIYLLRRYCSNEQNTSFIINDDIKVKLIECLQKWIELVIAQKKLSQSILLKVAQAIACIPSDEFVNSLDEMLNYELNESEKLQTPILNSQNDVFKYKQAFSAIGNNQVIALMKKYLPNLRFGVIAAQVLLDIWNKANSEEKNNNFATSNKFSKVRENYARVHGEKQPPLSSDFAEAIFVVIKDKCLSDNTQSKNHALKLAKIALLMPYGNKKDILNSLYFLPIEFKHKQSLLFSAAISGEIIPVDILNSGLQELLNDAKTHSWRLDENHGELMGWIELFPFSAQPMAVIEAIALLPEQYKLPWKIDRLLYALGDTPHIQALEVLETLVEQDLQFATQHAWLNALLKFKTEACAHMLFRMICTGKFVKNDMLQDLKLQKHLANLAKEFNLSDKLFQCYEKVTDKKSKSILEKTLIEISNDAIILRLIDCRINEYALYEAIQKIAIGQRSSTDWDGAFEQFSQPLADLRKKLFSIVINNDQTAALAEKCLIKIDELRDEYGHINEETRHPDIISDKPWPKVARLETRTGINNKW